MPDESKEVSKPKSKTKTAKKATKKSTKAVKKKAKKKAKAKAKVESAAEAEVKPKVKATKKVKAKAKTKAKKKAKRSSSSQPEAFAELGVSEDILRALVKMEFVTPSDVQAALIPPLLEGRDVVGQAKTGTGKTAAFGIPALQRIDPEGGLQVVCLAPTRELALQVTREMRRMGEFTGLKAVPIYGGQRVRVQINELNKKPHIVVGTPGRVLDLMGRGKLGFSDIRIAILDEVDRMLDIGFRDDIRKILGSIKQKHQTCFVSATIDDPIRRLIHTYTHEPVELNVSRDELTVEEIDQYYVSVAGVDKYRLLLMLLEQEKPEAAIIFTNTKAAARKVSKRLREDNLNARELHADLDQRKREQVMDRFRHGKINLLIATDVAARGIDVSTISHIINFDIPQDSESYVHRIGRTGRMGASGTSYTLVTEEEGKELTQIEKLINRQLEHYEFTNFQPRQKLSSKSKAEVLDTGVEAATSFDHPEDFGAGVHANEETGFGSAKKKGVKSKRPLRRRR